MRDKPFLNLFTPLKVGSKTLKNRIVSTGHDTTLPTDGTINPAYLAYQQARAKGGCGLIVLQVSAVHDSARYSSHVLMIDNDASVAGYRQMAETCHHYGATVFAQLFHPGKEIMETSDGLSPVAYSASAVPQERFYVMPRAMSPDFVVEIIAAYAAAAKRLEQAGIDGCEIVASHGYLPAQFLNPTTNQRNDRYGGDAEKRLQFLRDIVAAIRDTTAANFIVGLRISSREMDEGELDFAVTLDACKQLAPQLDYISVVAGTSATLKGSVHIVPPMTTENAYLAPDSRHYRDHLDIPVIVSGRINQPQEAEKVLANGEADLVGMTRALICDPLMPQKADGERVDDIRACIGCNQACIGHFHRGLPISCIQYPESGRELVFNSGKVPTADSSQRVIVAGGGPAGLKAASVAAKAGHQVTVYESSSQLGGQVLLAQKIPGRSEFGGLVTNLQRECELAGVSFKLNTRVDKALVEQQQPDVVLVATGALPYTPAFEQLGEMQVLNAWQVLNEEAKPGTNVLIADWRCDWIGMGLAEQLAGNGHQVKLAVNGMAAGVNIQSYVRTETTAALHRLGVETVPYMRLYGCDDDTVYMQHTASGEAVLFEGIDTLVLSQGHLPESGLAEEIAGLAEVQVLGDALAARTAEEAVLDGLRVAWRL